MEQEFLLLLKLFLTGIFLGLLYDCLRIWRSVMTNSRFWIDLLFFFFLFCFIGVVRGFLFFMLYIWKITVRYVFMRWLEWQQELFSIMRQ